MQQTELSGIVCARICHDLGSPIGALVNGVDLIREICPGDATEELEILERSARRAAALLRLHRLAFGAAGDAQAKLARGELWALAAEVFTRPRVEIACSAPEGPALDAAVVRLAALLVLAGRAMLGMSGTLRLVLSSSDALPVAVLVAGPKAAASPDQRRWLRAGPGPGPDAPEVEFALIPAAAEAAGARVELTEAEGQVALRALPP
ncbi:MAG TPA: histidine phosphotransferase family protein [Thermohalobaculum sp.]|nr:histidine phosphotransferase family protein [Thermohalobaculum sp.]